MNVENRIKSIKNYMLACEETISSDLSDKMSKYNDTERKIRDLFEGYKNDCREECDKKIHNRQELYKEAEQLIKGIRRNLYKKKRRQVKDYDKEPSDDIVKALEEEIQKFEKTILPYELKQLVDSIASFFDSDYGQAEVDKITSLYQSALLFAEEDDIRKEAEKDIQGCDNELSDHIEKMVNTPRNRSIDQEVDPYIQKLKEEIFESI